MVIDRFFTHEIFKNYKNTSLTITNLKSCFISLKMFYHNVSIHRKFHHNLLINEYSRKNLYTHSSLRDVEDLMFLRKL